MKIDFKTVESTLKPNILDIVFNTAYIRKNIKEENRTHFDGKEYTMFVYQEAALTLEEYAEYTNQIMAENALKGQNDSSNIVSLMSGQVMNDDNQITIMSALADIYEALLINTTGGV